MANVKISPAEKAARKALSEVFKCIKENQSFILEAGAGAGKTYSLIKALQHLIREKETSLLKNYQQIACITFTNVATNEIDSRTDNHPVIHSSTIHSFCWSLIEKFQPNLRSILPSIHNWKARLNEAGNIDDKRINYDLGYPEVREDQILLHHDDVLVLTAELMKYKKFRKLFVDRYPILLIDEYQDTNEIIVEAIKTHFLDTGKGPLIGFFGDHWQKIYGSSSCGKIEHEQLKRIGKRANFRSVPIIVDCLNRIRPELTQEVKDPKAKGEVRVFHSNNWNGSRKTGSHWEGDLPEQVASKYLQSLTKLLSEEDWEFSPEKTKILMLTHRVLGIEQGYSSIVDLFRYNDMIMKKQDPHIAFFVDTLEPVCKAYTNKRYGEMFKVMGNRTPKISSHVDKVSWSNDMDRLIELRSSANIGSVLDHLRETKRPRLPQNVLIREKMLEGIKVDIEVSERSIERLQVFRKISYSEVIALTKYLNGYTPFSTKHNIKGAEFENVLVVFGRGWNHYDFNEFLELSSDTSSIPKEKMDRYERNRNLFYVVCSRPKKRLTLLFTQELSSPAMNTLSNWFGATNIKTLQIN